jgi:phosphotransferase system enzyme I (PtsI)
MSVALHGIGIGGGIVIGRARLVSQADIEITHYVLHPQDIAAEIIRFEEAIVQTRHELDLLRDRIPTQSPAELSAFIDLHMMLLQDYAIAREPVELIKQEQCNAEWALKLQRDSLMKQFDEIEDNYLRERGQDIMQVMSRIFKALSGKHTSPSVNIVNSQSTVLVAHDLSPADLVIFKEAKFAAFMTDIGGPTSHTAILARSLEIPAVIALRHARDLIQDDEIIIVDSLSGVIIANPDAKTIAEYTVRQKKYFNHAKTLHRIRHTPAVTQDGTEIEVLANIELPEDAIYALENGAKGVGLFRSEFLFLSAEQLPDEEKQFLAYRQAVETMQNQPVIIRTLDLGKDKIPKWDHLDSHSLNPALGLMGIRLCLAEPQMFITQLRALLRAAHFGPIKLLLPMLSHVNEITQTRQLIADACASLQADGLPFKGEVELGGMIETPAAAVAITHFLEALDFVSIGTNDLIQYTLAVDRSDDAVSHLYNPLHPAILQLLHHTIQAANQYGTPVAICGEMAGDPFLTRLLLGIGLRRFSMLPAQLLKVKRQILDTDLRTIAPVIQAILASRDPENTRIMIQELNHLPC